MFRFAIIAITLLLSGCGNLNVIQDFHQKLINSQASDDFAFASWIDRSQYSFSLRVAHFGQYPESIQALKRACNAGKSVQLLLSEVDTPLAQSLKYSCVRVYLTRVPAMQSSSSAALMDGNSLLVDGQFRSGNSAALSEEFRAQNYILKYSHSLH